ncbi:hypothetical protein RJD38_00720 [Vibrio scophthalmi]|uniref:Uncharacterized protein n=1 Tax=Vibrio scophthalmi TaxID=45658 RepID=A0A1B1NPS8_9VIBR|nr:hypothetical protein [Vibrio scophthalmi]ANS85759.1 hypothetical protein VSVS12_01993 [Vibrio scophthalmi]ANU36103.1 hypothetical protein VSVS05_00976 [Vibrio scophthalmi]
MILELSPKNIFKVHVTFVVLLLCANVISRLKGVYLGDPIDLFNFNAERNVPTFFSGLMIAVCSVVLYLIAVDKRKQKLSYVPWLGLAFIFLFLSIDEIVSIHEKLTTPMRDTFETSKLLYYAWVLPYGIALMVFVVAYSRFLFSLSTKFRVLFVLSGFTFVSGAVGFEMLGGGQAEAMGIDNTRYFIYYTCEELLEMLGISIFLYTLLSYITQDSNSLNIVISK